ncbi:hydroxycinnamoyltransferase 1-like [Pistacia vera]|nr:hydroxycinnamoyltransferase 1-like [Pistacia vera]
MEDGRSRVNVHSILTSVSSRPFGAVKTYPLTQLGHAMGRHTIHLIFYYEKSPLGSFDVDPMRESLSEVLSLYPLATGRLTRDGAGNWEVKCNDAGVRVLRARVGVTLDEWLRSANGYEERDLTVWEDMPESPITWSPFRVQINDFEGGGLAIGVSCTHMHADSTSLALLLKAWSEANRRQPIAYPPSFHPPTPQPPSTNIETKSTNYLAAKSQAHTPPVKMATATFKFSDSTIKQCISRIHDKCPHANPFDLLAALFSTRILHLKGPKNDRTHSLSVCVDFRRLLQEPLPYGYFGNALYFSLLSINAEEIECGDLGRMAELVHCHVSGLKEEEFWSALHWLESQKEGGKYAPPFTMYGPELTCVSMEHMIVGDQSVMYSAIFDSARPVHVSCHVGNVEGEGLILVMPSAEGRARTVTVTLPEEEIAKLSKDQAILCLEPEVLFCGKV